MMTRTDAIRLATALKNVRPKPEDHIAAHTAYRVAVRTMLGEVPFGFHADFKSALGFDPFKPTPLERECGIEN
jgi:hypothetical protein